MLNSILWLLRTGAPWADLYQTCHRRFQKWCQDGTLERVRNALAERLKERGKLNLSETYVDGSFTLGT